jgi:hypothetical protein
MTVVMVISVTVIMVVGMPMNRTITHYCLPELAHLTIHLHLSQLSLDFPLP